MVINVIILTRVDNAICLMMFLMVGAFDDEEVIHVDGEVNPIRDLATINDELRLKDIELLNAAIEKMEKNVARTNDKKLKTEFVRLFLEK